MYIFFSTHDNVFMERWFSTKISKNLIFAFLGLFEKQVTNIVTLGDPFGVYIGMLKTLYSYTNSSSIMHFTHNTIHYTTQFTLCAKYACIILVRVRWFEFEKYSNFNKLVSPRPRYARTRRKWGFHSAGVQYILNYLAYGFISKSNYSRILHNEPKGLSALMWERACVWRSAFVHISIIHLYNIYIYTRI